MSFTANSKESERKEMHIERKIKTASQEESILNWKNITRICLETHLK